MRNKFLGLIFCITLMQTAWANVFEHPASLESIVKQIPQFDSISCRFKQAKTVPQVPVTLYSSGDFKFEKNKGVTFYTTSPVKTTTSYTTKEYRHINNVINAISNKSYSRLEKDFSFYYFNDTFGLIPKTDSQVHNYIKSIEITMDKRMITKMIIIAADSTKTTIWFQ